MLTLYGNPHSGSTNKVRYLLEYFSIPYTFKELDFEKDLKTPEYLKIHPAGKVPAINDDGFMLFESSAICKYLSVKMNNLLYPKDLKGRALIDQWIDFTTIHLGGAVYKVVWNRLFAPQMKMPVSEEETKKGLQELERYLPLIDEKLKKGPYLAGSVLSLADINLLATLEYADMAKISLTKYKALVSWRKKLQAMDFYQRIHPK